MDEKERAEYPGRTGQVQSIPKIHHLCQRRLDRAVSKSPYVRYMLDAMRKVGCEVNVDRQFVCEPCGPHVAGGYDPETQQVVLCENNIFSQGHMNDVLTHELVHTYDYCRAHLDWDNLEHLACTEIRAANLSGECFFWKENFTRFKFGWRKHHQVCVRERAMKSVLCIRDIPEKEAKRVVDKVFQTCFRDTVPFERVPP
ncbi:mitochondrial inner membrane protease ATP23 homolog isoform X2 [Halichondria panicea]|uniref:mitochondrial inner membrane protease ATP23 homolog isoform X2 n=1 Tax=Halichondria panicea TaxID=6063 RepID=UPI00312B7562